MDGVFIIGLPSQLRVGLEAAAKERGAYISTVLAGIGKKGTMQLLPDPSDAVHKFKAYYDQFGENYEDALVIVLPYAPIPITVDDELTILEELGGEIVYVSQGVNDWPILAKKSRPNTQFLNQVFRQIIIEIFNEENEKPSDYIRNIAEKNPNIIIIKGALDTCDQVAKHRHEFLKKSVDALCKFVEENGQVGRIDAFLRGLGLEHAQTGGISTKLTVLKNGKLVHQKTTNTHLKQGDRTTPQAAARIYYQEFYLDNQCYVAVIYVGPHPENDITRVHELNIF